MTFTIPDAELREFSGLPRVTQNRIHWLLGIMRTIAASRGTVATCKQIARSTGCHWNTLYNPWKRYKASGGDWRTLIDRRKTPEFWIKESPSSSLPHPFIQYWKTLCEQHQRTCSAAYHTLMLNLTAWRMGDITRAIPGYITPPPNNPGQPHPIGWSYANLMLHKPSDVELAAARNGREAAKALLPSVFTTRANMYPYQEIQFDDMWHDFHVLAPGHKSPARLMEFGCIDVCTGYIFPPGLKPRIRNADTGKMQHLNERDFRIYTVNFLCTVGWSPRGTKFIGERGTAAFRHLTEKIEFWTKGLVTTATGGMSGAPARIGDYSERAKGNFKIKALKEGSGRLIHSRLSDLPGQIGMDRNDRPASDYGRERDTLALAALEPHLPSEAFAQLQLGHLNFHHAVDLIYRAYESINARHDHRLEGWEALGFVIEQFRAAENIWIPLSRATELPEAQRTALTCAITLNPQTMLRRHRLSPTEALATVSTPNLTLSAEAEADMLLPDCGILRTAAGGLFTLQSADLGPEKMRFLASYQDSAGFIQQIPNGEQAIVVINPFRPHRAFLFSPRDQRYLGIAKPWLSADRTDHQAILSQHGAAQREYKDALLDANIRTGIQSIHRLKNNAAILRRTSALPTASNDPSLDAALLLDPQLDAHDQLPQQKHNYNLDTSAFL